MANVKLININKVYPNGVQAVFDFNIDIKNKEFVVFVGPSGCGKSTTLRMIAGLEEITTGELYIDDKLCNDISPKDRDIAMVFQSYALYPHMTVFANMAFGLKMRKIPENVLDKDGNEIKEIDNNKIQSLNKEIKKNKALIQKCTDLIEKIDIDTKQHKISIEENENKKKTLLADYENQLKEIEKISDEQECAKQKDELIKKTNVPLKPIETNIKKGNIYLKINERDKKLYQAKIEECNISIKQNEEKLKYYTTTPVNKVKYRHYTKEEIKEQVDRAAKILELEDYLYRKPSALSGGQRQRVALGRAIVRNAKVFLMDEPLSNLDAKLRVQMRTEIIKLHEQIGATTIYVTHDQTEAMTMADRIVVMKSGIVQQIGTPSEIYLHPANQFIAGFIGSPAMNFIDVTIKNGEFVVDGKQFKVNNEQLKALKKYNDKEIIFGIRPEDISVSLKPNNGIKKETIISELLGGELIVHFDCNEKQIAAKVVTKENIKQHTIIYIDFNMDSAHFFDKKTGITII